MLIAYGRNQIPKLKIKKKENKQYRLSSFFITNSFKPRWHIKNLWHLCNDYNY